MSYTPLELFGPILKDIPTFSFIKDGKSLADAIAKEEPKNIHEKYIQQKDSENFDAEKFILNHYTLNKPIDSGFKSDLNSELSVHIEKVWAVLSRQPDQKELSTKSILPFPYVVPGGRFNEIYYWDSYFTMEGLKVSGKIDMIRGMVNNFEHLINTIGHIPNGNRSYFFGRSQPPYFSHMVNLLNDISDDNEILRYRDALEKEYLFWMNGQNDISAENPAKNHVVLMPDGEILNRYWDNLEGPREEMYADDVHTASQHKSEDSIVYKNLRAGAASGWDYTSRWFADAKNISTIECLDIIPVDLNALLYDLEILLSKAFTDAKKSVQYANSASNRKQALIKYCYHDTEGFFYDYNYKNQKQTSVKSLAALQPLFSKMVDTKMAESVLSIVKSNFLKEGGLVTTGIYSGEQWDAPNGWAPLQWVGVKAALNYNNREFANEIGTRWMALNERIFSKTGKMMEKYNVEDMSLLAGGGEYDVQDGFGWSNGVYLALKDALK